MQLVYGSSSFDANSVWPLVQRELVRDDAERPYKVRMTVHVEGYLTASGQTNLMILESAFLTAMSRQYQNLVFYHDNASTQSPSITMLNSTSLTGVRISDVFIGSKYGAEYATQRYFRFTATADYALTGTAENLLAFRESVTLSGGLPKFVCRPALNGPPQRQLTWLQTPFRAVQEGEAVGFLAWPTPPAPIFPQFLSGDDCPVRRSSPRRTGINYQEWPVAWQYIYESPAPLVGVPNLWPLGL